MKIKINGKRYSAKPRFFIISGIATILAIMLLVGLGKFTYNNIICRDVDPFAGGWTYDTWMEYIGGESNGK